MCLGNNYTNYISLGYWCPVAMELEKFGLRSASFPFDWLLSDCSGVFLAIDLKFEFFFDENLFEQSSSRRYVYKNKKYGFEFLHDFSKYKSLSEQFDCFRDKYSRRIFRFYEAICEPTLFVRYIRNKSDLEWIENNKDFIFATITKYNKKNDIIFVAEENIVSEQLHLFHVVPDKKDIYHNIFSSNKVLNNYFETCQYPPRGLNRERYLSKKKFTKKTMQNVSRYLFLCLKKVFLKVYIHDSVYNEL